MIRSNTRTALSRVEGLGAAHSGVVHFWRQRITGAALVPLACWFAWLALSQIGAERSDVAAFLHLPVNAILMALFVVLAALHMAIGVQVVIEDYIEHEGRKILLLVLNQAFALGVAAVALYAIGRIAFS